MKLTGTGPLPSNPIMAAVRWNATRGVWETTRDELDELVARTNAGEYINTAPRAEQEKRGCIRTYTGLYVNPLAMRARDIRIEDIAHHLSLICRYTGACPRHYSVGQHSLLVADYLADMHASLELELAGLLHDAAEYVLNDIASPVKHDPRMQWYRDMDTQLSRLIFARFGIDPDLLHQTKAADDAVFRQEVGTWWGGTHYIAAAATPASVEDAFLERFHKLHTRLNR